MISLQRRDQILNAAKEIFSKKGYHATSISDIIAAAGIARGTFYLYFENKHQIFEALLDSLLKRLESRLTRISLEEGGLTPIEQLKERVAGVISLLLDDRMLTQILLHYAVGLDVEFDTKLAAFYQRLVEMIDGALRLGIEMNLIRKCETRVVAQCILGSVKEVVDQLTRQREVGDLDAVVEEVVEFGLRGLSIGPLG